MTYVGVLGFLGHVSLQEASSRILEDEGGTFVRFLALLNTLAKTGSCCKGLCRHPVASAQVDEAGVERRTSSIHTGQAWVMARAEGARLKAKSKSLKVQIRPPQSLEGTTLNTARHTRTVERI